MMTRYRIPVLRLWFLALLIAAIVISGLHIMPVSQASVAMPQRSSLTRALEYGFVYSATNEGMICRPTTASERPFLFEENPDLPMHVISRGELSPQAGSDITFMLRGTQQLEANQQAKAVFLRAADLWRQRLKSIVPITIIVDVDFGPNFFGTPFEEDVLGGTLSQILGDDALYPAVQASLLDQAETAEEINLYSLLPTATLPTNRGSTQVLAAPSALLRALRLISPVANPALEPDFGSPPKIGFNSGFVYDFDPSNGIAQDAIDFEAVCVHEIGHLLGFTSLVGLTELDRSAPVAVAILDLFRFRPGTTMDTFASAQRIVSSGGQQVFFAGGAELALSTGRPNGAKGDRRQASHWKDDGLSGIKLGIMDPTLAFGEHVEIGVNDLLALDSMGFRLAGNPLGNPVIRSAAGSLVGNVLNLSGTVIDTQEDISQAQVTILGAGSNAPVLRQSTVAVTLGSDPIVNFNIAFAGLGDLPTAAQAEIVFIDEAGNNSNGVVVDFSQRDPGGPTIKKATLNGDETILNVKGTALRGEMQVEVNGVILFGGPHNNNKKISLPVSQLNFQQGPNRLRLIVNNLRTNIFVVNR